MRRFSNIDNVFVQKHGLSLQEAYLLEWFQSVPSWASTTTFNGEVYYFASKNKACEDLPILTKKIDTMYRYYKKLAEKNIIDIIKVNGKDYVRILEIGKQWNSFQRSEDYPSDLGQTSEKPSDKIPTNSNNTIDSNTNIEGDLFGNKPNPSAKTLFKNSAYFDLSIFKNKLKEFDALGIDVEYYHRAINNWSEMKNQKRTANGWVATARNWMERDKDKNLLRMQGQDLQQTTKDEMSEYLGM